mmetsp:Transcript_68877/g.199446  ORF Transcript_68877/g.199446 Transcript_68877/m.199446 type:complete len:201 (-) Transcript_68877:511-1113(-)
MGVRIEPSAEGSRPGPVAAPARGAAMARSRVEPASEPAHTKRRKSEHDDAHLAASRHHAARGGQLPDEAELHLASAEGDAVGRPQARPDRAELGEGAITHPNGAGKPGGDDGGQPVGLVLQRVRGLGDAVQLEEVEASVRRRQAGDGLPGRGDHRRGQIPVSRSRVVLRRHERISAGGAKSPQLFLGSPGAVCRRGVEEK